MFYCPLFYRSATIEIVDKKDMTKWEIEKTKSPPVWFEMNGKTYDDNSPLNELTPEVCQRVQFMLKRIGMLFYYDMRNCGGNFTETMELLFSKVDPRPINWNLTDVAMEEPIVYKDTERFLVLLQIIRRMTSVQTDWYKNRMGRLTEDKRRKSGKSSTSVPAQKEYWWWRDYMLPVVQHIFNTVKEAFNATPEIRKILNDNRYISLGWRKYNKIAPGQVKYLWLPTKGQWQYQFTSKTTRVALMNRLERHRANCALFFFAAMDLLEDYKRSTTIIELCEHILIAVCTALKVTETETKSHPLPLKEFVKEFPGVLNDFCLGFMVLASVMGAYGGLYKDDLSGLEHHTPRNFQQLVSFMFRMWGTSCYHCSPEFLRIVVGDVPSNDVTVGLLHSQSTTNNHIAYDYFTVAKKNIAQFYGKFFNRRFYTALNILTTRDRSYLGSMFIYQSMMFLKDFNDPCVLFV